MNVTIGCAPSIKRLCFRRGSNAEKNSLKPFATVENSHSTKPRILSKYKNCLNLSTSDQDQV